MTLSPDQYLFSSLNDTLKNSDTKLQTITVTGASFAAGELSKTFTYTIPISNGINLSQIKAQPSFDSGKWHIVPLSESGAYSPSTSTRMQLYARYTSDNLIIYVRVIPVGSSPYSFSTFTVDISAKIFILPTP